MRIGNLDSYKCIKEKDCFHCEQPIPLGDDYFAIVVPLKGRTKYFDFKIHEECLIAFVRNQREAINKYKSSHLKPVGRPNLPLPENVIEWRNILSRAVSHHYRRALLFKDNPERHTQYIDHLKGIEFFLRSLNAMAPGGKSKIQKAFQELPESDKVRNSDWMPRNIDKLRKRKEQLIGDWEPTKEPTNYKQTKVIDEEEEYHGVH